MSDTAKKLATIEDLLALPEDSRMELIDGQLVPKEVASFEHNVAQTTITAEIAGRFGRSGSLGPGGWWIATEVETYYETQDLCFLHDIAGWKRERHPEKPTGRPMRMRPDWVCEILSPSNWKHDTVTKFQVLFANKVPHYWIVDVQHQELTIYRWSKDGYVVAQKVVVNDGAIKLEPFTEIEIDVASLFGIENL